MRETSFEQFYGTALNRFTRQLRLVPLDIFASFHWLFTNDSSALMQYPISIRGLLSHMSPYLLLDCLQGRWGPWAPRKSYLFDPLGFASRTLYRCPKLSNSDV
ncbi:hypothetical protein VN12_08045 [Pirellula sp. SH-Sr6A]|nr:hypothetical protein VN12_08045 [Pirellula sp. SH-Sr6A]